MSVIAYWWAARRHVAARNAVLLSASYAFYAWWDWRLVPLIVLSTIVDYTARLKIAKNQGRKVSRSWVAFSVTTNLSLLGIFKYFGFFVESWVDAWALLGVEISTAAPEIVHIKVPRGAEGAVDV